MKEERMQILRMIQEGIISAEEGASLLAALGQREQAQRVREEPVYPDLPMLARRWLRIRVTDPNNERDRVNLTVPIGLLDWGLRMAEMTAGVRLTAVREVIRSGAEGKILEIDDAETNQRLEIFVE